MVAPAAKAAAEAAWPDGKDEVHGACGSRRAAGTSASGRLLDARPLPMMLAVALATARLARPRRAARPARRLPVACRQAASAIQSFPWLAASLSAGMARSSAGEFTRAPQRTAARSSAAIRRRAPRRAGPTQAVVQRARAPVRQGPGDEPCDDAVNDDVDDGLHDPAPADPGLDLVDRRDRLAPPRGAPIPPRHAP